MATRSRIGIEILDAHGEKTVRSIYCHWDGNPSHNGKILQENYLDRDKVMSLISLGDISSLGKEVDPTGPHTFEKPQKEVTVAYHRDRGEDFRVPHLHYTVSGFINGDIEEYGYLFTADGEWLLIDGSTREVVSLTSVL